jgi:hypothetical protein
VDLTPDVASVCAGVHLHQVFLLCVLGVPGVASVCAGVASAPVAASVCAGVAPAQGVAFSKKIVYSMPNNYDRKNYCVAF